jgi:outer membrane protein assembly factor BamB
MKRLLLLALFLAACGGNTTADSRAGYGVPLDAASPWPKFRRDAQQRARAGFRPVAGRGEAWTFKTGKGIFSSPVIDGAGVTYLGSADRNFYALDAAGKVRWKVATGEIIDSAGLLDDRGRVYVGSGDGKLRAIDRAKGTVLWEFAAEDPETVSAYINWFEGNVAMLPDGTLLAPNDNYHVYAVDRETGKMKWKFRSGDQNWSLPAVDPATGFLFFGNNNVTEIFGPNTFSIDGSGVKRWGAFVPGTIAASALVSRGRVIVGGFDGFVRAYAAADGKLLWSFGARDHVYASAAELSDGTVVVPAADGTVYALNSADGRLRWAYDTREALRSSPAVDALDRVYLGSGEGRLYVLNADGTRRWAMQLVGAGRNDLNSSPALGPNGVVVAGESGEIFSVPFDYCLGEGARDARCIAGGAEDLPADGAFLLYTSNFGNAQTAPPAAVAPNAALAFSLFVRKAGDTALALLDSASVKVTVTPAAAVDVEVSGDRHFLTVAPRPEFATTGGAFTVRIQGGYLLEPKREGLRFTGGTHGGSLDETFTFQAAAAGPALLPLPFPAAGSPAGAWEAVRLAAPMPTILPSYNQIGFDSLHFLVGLVEGAGGHGVAWMIGGKPAEPGNATAVDPATKAMYPLEVTYVAGRLTMVSGGVKLEAMSAEIGFSSFRLATRLDAEGEMAESANILVTLVCADLGFFASFVRDLGFCNPENDRMSAFGAIDLHPWNGGTVAAPPGVGTVRFTVSGSTVRADVTGSALAVADHAVALMLVDAATGRPVFVDYGLKTTVTATAGGKLQAVSLDREKTVLPPALRIHLMVDTYPAATTTYVDPG